MPILNKKNADIYYEETGSGEPLIAIHGLTESTLYWSLPGVTGKLAENFRVISMDMRGHGRTIVHGEPSGFDAETMGEDISSLADHLGIGKFHLLTHSTGGFVSSRYAMKNSSRLLSLIFTDTSSATAVINAKPESIKRFNDKFAKSFENKTWDDVFADIAATPGPFYRGIAESDPASRDKMMAAAKKISEINDLNTIPKFIRSFYKDPDPMIEGLRKITCPALIIYGEKDDLFIEPGKLLANEIPGAKLIEYKGIGHMTALEAPERLAEDVTAFIKGV